MGRPANSITVHAKKEKYRKGNSLFPSITLAWLHFYACKLTIYMTHCGTTRVLHEAVENHPPSGPRALDLRVTGGRSAPRRRPLTQQPDVGIGHRVIDRVPREIERPLFA